jgi:hypothetical protein
MRKRKLNNFKPPLLLLFLFLSKLSLIDDLAADCALHQLFQLLITQSLTFLSWLPVFAFMPTTARFLFSGDIMRYEVCTVNSRVFYFFNLLDCSGHERRRHDIERAISHSRVLQLLFPLKISLCLLLAHVL